MTFAWTTLATLAVLSAAVHWLVGRAEITKPVWDAIWLPARIGNLLRCPACSGFWIGLGLGGVGVRPIVTGYWWVDVLAAGITAMYTTPVAEAVMLWGLERSRID